MGIISIDTEGLKSIAKILGKVVNSSIGALPDVISTTSKVVNEFGESIEVINEVSNTSDGETMAQTLNSLQSIVVTISTLISGMDTVVNNFEDAEYSNTSTVTNLGGEIFSNLLNTGLSVVSGVTQGDLTNIDVTGITGMLTSLINNSLSSIISSPQMTNLVSGLLTNLGMGISEIISSLTGVEDKQAEENVNAIVAELIKMMDAIEIQEGLTAMVGLINAELGTAIIGTLGTGVKDVINMGTKISTQTLTVQDVTKTFSNFIDGCVGILSTGAVTNLVNYVDGKVLTLNNAILGLDGITVILDAYSNNVAVASMGEAAVISQDVVEAASVLLKVGINVLSQPHIANLITTIDDKVITLDKAKVLLTGVSNLLQVNSPLGAVAVLTQVTQGLLAGISLNDIKSSLVGAFTSLIIKGDYTDGNIGNLLSQSDVLDPIMQVYGDQLSQVNMNDVLQQGLDQIGVQGLTGEMVVNFVGGLLNAAISLATNEQLLGLINKINLDAIKLDSVGGALSGVIGLVTNVLQSGNPGEILQNPEITQEALGSAMGLLGSVVEGLGGEETLSGALSFVTGTVTPLASSLIGTLLSTVSSIASSNGADLGNNEVLGQILSSDVVTGLLNSASGITISQLLPNSTLSGDITNKTLGDLLTTTEGLETLVSEVGPLITVATGDVLSVITQILSSFSGGTAVQGA